MHKTMRRRNTIFVALPIDTRKPIEWGCDCQYCKAHPNLTPAWDTLAINANQKDGREDYATPVHYPEFANACR